MEETARQFRLNPLFETGEVFGADPKLGNRWNLGKIAYSYQISQLATGKIL